MTKKKDRLESIDKQLAAESGRFAYGSFRLLAVRLRLELIRLRLICLICLICLIRLIQQRKSIHSILDV